MMSRDPPRAQDALLPVDILDERIEGHRPLHEPAFE
jgi:hypothetical protein